MRTTVQQPALKWRVRRRVWGALAGLQGCKWNVAGKESTAGERWSIIEGLASERQSVMGKCRWEL